MKKTFLLLLLCSIFGTAYSQKTLVDLVVLNAKVYTVDSNFSTAEAFAIKNGKFVEIGSNDNILKKYKTENVVNAKSLPVFPGFYDPHSHFLGLGQMLSQCDLVGTKSYQEIVERLKAFAKEHPNNQWIIGRGWDQNDWDVKVFPSKEMLDEAFPNKPVYLTRIDGHAAVINSKAIQLSKITSASKIDGGDVELKNGELTGILIDNAMGLVRMAIPRSTESEKKKIILDAQKMCFSLITNDLLILTLEKSPYF